MGFEGDGFRLGGVRVLEQQWQAPIGLLKLPHPAYPNQTHEFAVYEVEAASQLFRFAACELSAGVWGFYLPDEQTTN